MTIGSGRRRVVLEALFVMFLRSTSWVLIKVGLRDTPALTFAGLRCTLAFLCLLPWQWRASGSALPRGLSPRRWGEVIGLGVLFYVLTRGGQFVALAHLPAVTVNLVLSLTVVMVTVLDVLLLGERPSCVQGFLRFPATHGESSSGWRWATPRSPSPSGIERFGRCRRWSPASSTTR